VYSWVKIGRKFVVILAGYESYLLLRLYYAGTIHVHQIFFRGGGGQPFQGGRWGVKFVDPIFNGQVFTKKKSIFFSKKIQKIIFLCFFEKKMKKNRQYQVNFVFCYSCAL
jgi:hypothetical protein